MFAVGACSSAVKSVSTSIDVDAFSSKTVVADDAIPPSSFIAIDASSTTALSTLDDPIDCSAELVAGTASSVADITSTDSGIIAAASSSLAVLATNDDDDDNGVDDNDSSTIATFLLSNNDGCSPASFSIVAVFSDTAIPGFSVVSVIACSLVDIDSIDSGITAAASSFAVVVVAAAIVVVVVSVSILGDDGVFKETAISFHTFLAFSSILDSSSFISAIRICSSR